MPAGGSSRAEILPKKEFWLEMRIDPDKVLAQFKEDKAQQTIRKFRLEHLQEFYDAQTGRNAEALSKDALVGFICRREPILVHTLFLIEQYSRWVSAAVLRRFCSAAGCVVGNETRAQLSLMLFNHAPEMLRRVRIVSIGHKIQTNYGFSANPNVLKAGLDDTHVIEQISRDVEEDLSTPDKRAKLVEHYSDPQEDYYRLYVKHEERDLRVEEWDSGHWDKPVDWVVAEYDRKGCYLTVRCKDERRARQVASIISKRLTGTEEGFRQADFGEWLKPEIKEVPEVPEKEGFRVLDLDIRALTIENVRIRNAPTIEIKGHKVNESISDLETKYGFNPMQDAEIAAYEIKVRFEYQGVSHETTVKLAKGKRTLVVSREIRDRVKKHLIDYLGEVLGGG